MRPVPVVLLSLCLMLGCDQGEIRVPVDGGTEDAGMGSGHDAGSVLDAGTERDAGTDPDPDAGTSQDAGTDAGTEVTPCGIPYLGDPTAAPAFTPTALEPDGTVGSDGPGLKSAALVEGSTVSIVQPPQGGRVAFLGVRGVNNMDPCGATLLGALRDPVSGLVQIDQRQFNLTRGADGLGASDDEDIFTFSNVSLCPNNWSAQDIFDQDYKLTLILQDRKGRKLTQFLTVRPACNVASQASDCRCICKKGYRLGDPCP